jgi:hypothetical protein
LYATILEGGTAKHDLSPERHAWLQVARGSLQLNGIPLEAGDGAAASNSPSLEISGEGEALLFDLN